MDENKILCEIKWTVKDVITSFKSQAGREPTESELEDCINTISWKLVEETGIANGWTIVNTAVNDIVWECARKNIS